MQSNKTYCIYNRRYFKYLFHYLSIVYSCIIYVYSNKNVTMEGYMDYILLNKVEENEINSYMPSEKKLKNMACFFQNFADSTRLKIISALSINELCVNDLSNVLNINQTTISHQLKYLKNQCIVESKRDGKIIKYSLQNKFINDLMNYAIESLKDINF